MLEITEYTMEELVQKLASPIEEIQKRALESIHDKLRFNITESNDLVTSTNICEILVKLLADRTNTENLNRKSILPDENKFLSLLKILAEESSHGRQILINLNLIRCLTNGVTSTNRFNLRIQQLN